MIKQVGALPIRTDKKGNVEVLLVTSRETRRWVIPKGWPWADRADHLAAAAEAHEEAGVLGRTTTVTLGYYSYQKKLPDQVIAVRVEVYVLKVKRELDSWRERKQRKRAWFPIEEAAAKVDEIGLRRLMRKLAVRKAEKAKGSRGERTRVCLPGKAGSVTGTS